MKKSSQTKPVLVNQSPEIVQSILTSLALDLDRIIKEGVYSYLADGVRLVINLLLEAEVKGLCGERYKHDPEREANRWGSEPGTAIVNGTKERIKKPRVRSASDGKEIRLATYEAFNESGVLSEKILNSVLAGVSTRRYVNLVDKQLRKYGVSKSSVSRRTIEETKPILDSLLNRPLADMNLVAIFMDGINIGKRQVIVCIGVTAGGKKQVIGLRVGATENEVVCRDLLRNLKERGLKEDRKYLFVIDGSQALAAAIRAAFGDDTHIQRCLEHKIRDVEAYVPVKLRTTIRAKLQAAWNQKTEKEALKRLSQVRSSLLRFSETAANSLTEGMLDTVTLQRLGVTGELKLSLSTTNVIESAFSAVRRLTAKPTRYRSEKHIVTWLARGSAKWRETSAQSEDTANSALSKLA